MSIVLSIDTVNKTEMLIIYQPINVFHTIWAVLLMQPQIINGDSVAFH
jgi:hypothetical protein